MDSPIIVSCCSKCPFNYDGILCEAINVKINGEYDDEKLKKGTIDLTEEGFPNGCPLIDGSVVVRKKDEE